MNNAIPFAQLILLGFRGTRTVSGERLEMRRTLPIAVRSTRACHEGQHATETV
jgi:hypothetical protein